MQYEPQISRYRKMAYSIMSGGTASLVTQPFEVIKTVSLCNISPIVPNTTSSSSSPLVLQTLAAQLKSIYNVEQRGIRNFFRGGGVGFFRQALGFSLYSQILEELNAFFKHHPSKATNKWWLTASIAAISKGIAITLSCPLVVLKTRLELALTYNKSGASVENSTISLRQHVAAIVSDKGYFKGLSSLLSRELAFSVFHYTTFQFCKKHFDENQMFKGNTFIAPYLSGVLGVILSQPFEVIRSRMMINQQDLPAEYRYQGLANALKTIAATEGITGYFKGIVPRLIRKPINTAISWGVYELLKHPEQSTQ